MRGSTYINVFIYIPSRPTSTTSEWALLWGFHYFRELMWARTRALPTSYQVLHILHSCNRTVTIFQKDRINVSCFNTYTKFTSFGYDSQRQIRICNKLRYYWIVELTHLERTILEQPWSAQKRGGSLFRCTFNLRRVRFITYCLTQNWIYTAKNVYSFWNNSVKLFTR